LIIFKNASNSQVMDLQGGNDENGTLILSWNEEDDVEA